MRELQPADIFADATRSLRARPGRALGIMVGIVLGVASAVSTNGLAATARFQVSDSFDSLRATQVDVQATAVPEAPLAVVSQRLSDVSGVDAAGAIVTSQASTVDLSLSRWIANSSALNPRLVGIDQGFLSAAETSVIRGHTFSVTDQRDGARVALLGPRLAQSLSIDGNGTQDIFVDGIPLRVVGVTAESQRFPQLDNSIILPVTTLQVGWRSLDFGSFIIKVAPGNAKGVSEVAAVVMQPDGPEIFDVTPPVDPRGLRGVVDGQLEALGWGVSAFALLVGVLSIAGATATAVNERLGEFGLRRAVGALPRDLRTLILTECLILGLIAGTIGTLVGAALVLGISASQDWVPVLDRNVVLLAPLLGVLTGLAAGVLPARRASRIQPVDALRG